MASKEQQRAAQLAIALRRGQLKAEDVPEDLRDAVDALKMQDEDSLADLTRGRGEQRSEAVKRAVSEAQRQKARSKERPWGPLGTIFDTLRRD